MFGQVLKQLRVFEAAIARYRALLSRTRYPGRRQMLEEMIAREVAAARQLEIVSSNIPPEGTPKIIRLRNKERAIKASLARRGALDDNGERAAPWTSRLDTSYCYHDTA